MRDRLALWTEISLQIKPGKVEDPFVFCGGRGNAWIFAGRVDRVDVPYV